MTRPFADTGRVDLAETGFRSAAPLTVDSTGANRPPRSVAPRSAALTTRSSAPESSARRPTRRSSSN
ncbi:hypothetical protein [Azospirillum sp. B4]|uniref:hypothetical protein n=1 Tax=Azospirillum sp. B4 TaxID=95605 RepID=UPI00131F2311|nr:hypothetical protein [Azospirillum sp. B4]